MKCETESNRQKRIKPKESNSLSMVASFLDRTSNFQSYRFIKTSF